MAKPPPRETRFYYKVPGRGVIPNLDDKLKESDIPPILVAREAGLSKVTVIRAAQGKVVLESTARSIISAFNELSQSQMNFIEEFEGKSLKKRKNRSRRSLRRK